MNNHKRELYVLDKECLRVERKESLFLDLLQTQISNSLNLHFICYQGKTLLQRWRWFYHKG